MTNSAFLANMRSQTYPAPHRHRPYGSKLTSGYLRTRQPSPSSEPTSSPVLTSQPRPTVLLPQPQQPATCMRHDVFEGFCSHPHPIPAPDCFDLGELREACWLFTTGGSGERWHKPCSLSGSFVQEGSGSTPTQCLSRLQSNPVSPFGGYSLPASFVRAIHHFWPSFHSLSSRYSPTSSTQPSTF
jgi:hypothetical protein